MKLHQVTVPREAARSRLDLFLARQLPQFSRSRLQQLIRDQLVRLNGQPARPRDAVRTGDAIEVREPPPAKIDNRPEEIPLDILFEDVDLIVINKPAGLVVHPGAGHRGGTLVNALLHHCPALSGIGGKERPGIVHRLDKETTGCVVIAKNDAAHRGLAEQFAARNVEKVYLAIVAGKLKRSAGVIDEKIGRHPVHRQRMTVARADSRGREAKTEYRVLKSTPIASKLSSKTDDCLKQSSAATLVECKLHSGRTHQIRVHLHHLGHPVLGDKVYGAKHAKNFPRQMLHAWKLGFQHPRTGGWKTFEAPAPPDFYEPASSLESSV